MIFDQFNLNSLFAQLSFIFIIVDGDGATTPPVRWNIVLFFHCLFGQRWNSGGCN